ncbi:MAG TPA: bifunctional diaminohydroxyphosphoribosylaminopyrimidine deaminase/5-amino-6-(5-phosphoribosylamino)uracil reductase RibD [Vicinamibacterales bacterium]|nr:bifunctional diaminohydroxyphosphoribosylaminopyrimidine deaminase/5-amino-6-(5-phosphoribosylamino)uracil reductase RibD [Vicinamibacterales bacterium]
MTPGDRAAAPTDRRIAFMQRALALAERGRGRTSPNPMVGALVVDEEGVIVGRGAHEYAGGPHAEIHALADAGERAQGATLYCTLEPCCHTGRTGPCAPRIVEAGIRRAVIAVEDPNPVVAGRGIAHLRDHGIEVEVGIGRDEATRLNRAFFTRVTLGRPFVTMKAAVSLDGCVAAEPGVRTALTGAESNRLLQRERAEVDAIAVGSGTVLVDDPVLTARGAYRYRPLTRVVFDRRLRTTPAARLFSTLAAGPVIIVTGPTAGQSRDRAEALAQAGATIVGVEAGPGSTEFLGAALRRLADAGTTTLVVEGGPMLHAAFWRAGLVDRLELVLTPQFLRPTGVPWDATGIGTVASLVGTAVCFVGEDVWIEGDVHRAD